MIEMYYFNILKANYGSKASKKEREAQEAERQSAANTMSEGAGSRHHSDRNLAEGRKIGDRFGDWKTRPIDIEDTEDVYFPEGIFDRLRDQTVPVSIRDDSGDWIIDSHVGSLVEDELIARKLQEHPFHPYGPTKVYVYYETPMGLPDAVEKVVVEYIKKGSHFDTIWINKDGGVLAGQPLERAKAVAEPSSPSKPSKYDTDPQTGESVIDEDNLEAWRSQGRQEFDVDEDAWFQQLERHPKEREANRYDSTLHSEIELTDHGYNNGVYLFHGDALGMAVGMTIEWSPISTSHDDLPISMFDTSNLNWRKWK